MRRWMIALALLAGQQAHAEDWLRFRGPNGTGTADDPAVPLKWTEKNILWKTAIPGKGYSSPIVVKGKVILQNSTPDDKARELSCFDEATGKLLWSKTLEGGAAKTHAKNSPASSTPASDGTSVFAAFWDGSDQWLGSWDLDGKPRWKISLGGFASQHGAGMSPVVHGGKVFVNNDQDGKAEIQAYNAADGKLAWKKARAPFRACYSTPFFTPVDGKPALVVASTAGITAYDPDTGSEKWAWEWKFASSPLRTVASPIEHQGLIYAASGDGGGDRSFVVIDPMSKGKPELVWEMANKAKKGPAAEKTSTPYVPTMLAHDGHIFWVTDQGLAACLDAKTGKLRWSERVGSGGISASPVLLNGHVLGVTEDGTVFAFKAAAEFEQVLKFKLNETTLASPAVADGKVFLRTAKHLIAVGTPK